MSGPTVLLYNVSLKNTIHYPKSIMIHSFITYIISISYQLCHPSTISEIWMKMKIKLEILPWLFPRKGL